MFLCPSKAFVEGKYPGEYPGEFQVFHHVTCNASNVDLPLMLKPDARCTYRIGMPLWTFSSGVVVATTLIATLLHEGTVVDGARIKIHLATDSALYSDTLAMGRLRPRQAPRSACNDKQALPDGSGLPPGILNNQEFNRTRVRFYSSATAKEYISAHTYSPERSLV